MCYLIFIYIKSHLICFKKSCILLFFQILQYSLLFGIWWHLKCNQPVFQSQKNTFKAYSNRCRPRKKKNPSAYCLLHILARISTKTHRGVRNCFIPFPWEYRERTHTGSRNGKCWKAWKVCDQWVINAGFCREPSEGVSWGKLHGFPSIIM